MAFDERLADRIRDVIQARPDVVEKKMFGGIAFLVNGAMCVGVDKDDLIVRCEKDETESRLLKKGVREFDLSGGRPMKGWLLVGPQATGTSAGFNAWIEFARARASSPTRAKKRPTKRRAARA